MNKLKVFQGTRTADAPRLCDSCDMGVVLRGTTDSEEYVYCTLMEKQITMRVTDCNRYTDRALAPLWALQDIAWVLRTDSKRQTIGFVRAKEQERTNDNPVPEQSV